MSRVCRINHISHRVFYDFTWDSSVLEDFSRYNVIYGWNGSGKSTLSNLFVRLQKGEALTEGKAEFLLDGKPLSLNAITRESIVPPVRVFNRSFIVSNVFVSETSPSDLAPIYFLGEDSIGKEKQITQLTAELAREGAAVSTKESDVRKQTSELDAFCIEQAKKIKLHLRSSGENFYNNYDKGDFRQAISKLAKKSEKASHILTEDEQAALARQKDGTAKPLLKAIIAKDPALDSLRLSAKELLNTTVVSHTIAELTANKSVATWVGDGLRLHTGEHAIGECRFCGQEMPTRRLADLEAHFNDRYRKLINDIENQVQRIRNILNEFDDLAALPHNSELYEHLTVSYESSVKKWEAFVSELRSYLEALISTLCDKKTRAFERMELEDSMPVQPDWASAKDFLEDLNSVVSLHNQQTNSFQATVSDSRSRLAKHYVAEKVNDFSAKEKRLKDDEAALKTHRANVQTITKKIEKLKSESEEHRRPAEQLNEELKSYLGRSELQFQIKDRGYQLTRDGIPATNLSEGEKTAIAFLYFLKSLEDVNFDLAKGVVVIDDPVSSLDSNALFSAFSYMKERTKDAGQMFVLTHNFAFFRQVKNWFHRGLRGENKKKCRFYMLTTCYTNDRRCSLLQPLDRLLREFESDYHYLFKRVYEEANRTGHSQLEDFYSLPNVARRLLEGFLAFRYPSAGDLYAKLQMSGLDQAKRTRLHRFVDTYSHRNFVDDEQHDPTLLTETPLVLKELLEFIGTEDKRHYDEMIKAIAPETATATAGP